MNNVVLTPAQSSGGTLLSPVELRPVCILWKFCVCGSGHSWFVSISTEWGPLQRWLSVLVSPAFCCGPSLLFWTIVLLRCRFYSSSWQLQSCVTATYQFIFLRDLQAWRSKPDPMMVPPLTLTAGMTTTMNAVLLLPDLCLFFPYSETSNSKQGGSTCSFANFTSGWEQVSTCPLLQTYEHTWTLPFIDESLVALQVIWTLSPLGRVATVPRCLHLW